MKFDHGSILTCSNEIQKKLESYEIILYFTLNRENETKKSQNKDHIFLFFNMKQLFCN